MDLAKLLERGRKTTRRKRSLRPTRPSKRSEVWYRDQLLDFVAAMQGIVLEELKQQPLNDAAITKGEQIWLAKKLDDIIGKLQDMATGDFAVSMATGVVGRANEQNKSSLQSIMKNAFGIDMKGMMGNQVVSETLQLAVQNNVNLIKSIQTDFINEISGVIRESISQGRRNTDMISMIMERGEVSKGRARVIARDQTAKINSDLTRERYQSLGINMYQWGGVGDVRERMTHRLLNGKLCRYDDPTVYSDDGGKTWKKRSTLRGTDPKTGKTVSAYIGHPGEDIQCRCVALPYVQIDEAA